MQKQRLEKILKYITEDAPVADIGTDHGYIPIRLAGSGFVSELYACDINEGPLDNARRNALEAGCDKNIQFVLSDGFEKLDLLRIRYLIIAGMGGESCCGIMDRAEKKITEDNIFIFQPATKPEVLRYWLLYNSYEILAEDYVKENGKLYQIIVAKLGEPQKYTLSEMYTGTAYGNELYPEIREHCADMFSKILCFSDESRNPDHKVIQIMYDELKEGMKNGKSL